MATNAFVEKVITASSALDTAGAWSAARTRGQAAAAITVIFGAGTSAGAVTLETAPYAEYTGVWHIAATATWAVAANKVVYARADGPFMAIRARISTAIVGGTVDVYMHAVD